MCECWLGLLGVCLCLYVHKCAHWPNLHVCAWNVLDTMSRCVHFRGGTHTCLCLSRSPWSPLYVIIVPVFVCSSVPLTCVSTRVCSGEHIHACARSAGPIRVKECVCHVKQVCASILACEGPCLCPWVCAPRVRSVCVLLGTSTHRRSSQSVSCIPLKIGICEHLCVQAVEDSGLCLCVCVCARARVCVIQTHTHIVSGGRDVRAIDFSVS